FMEKKISPLPWVMNPYNRGVISTDTDDAVKRESICIIYGDPDGGNAEAILTAINSTYGKGIDPSSVPELVEAMKEMMECFDAEGGWISDACLVRCGNSLNK